VCRGGACKSQEGDPGRAVRRILNHKARTIHIPMMVRTHPLLLHTTTRYAEARRGDVFRRQVPHPEMPSYTHRESMNAHTTVIIQERRQVPHKIRIRDRDACRRGRQSPAAMNIHGDVPEHVVISCSVVICRDERRRYLLSLFFFRRQPIRDGGEAR